ncbi:MAG: PQQ-dependent sugar dehydrogenase [Chloroflexota bacterium]
MPAPRRMPVALEALALVTVIGAAAALRSWNLWDIPRFTDEVEEAGLALQIVQRQALPLTNVDPYIGSLWSYILAAGFLLGGQSLYLPRVVVLLFGVATVAVTFLLGRSYGGVWAGLVAAALLATSAVHIAVNSHIAWSNCVTPLFTTLGLWLLHRAVVSGNSSRLVWSGLAFGLAVQTHPVAAFLGPAVAAVIVHRHPRWLLTRWPYAAAALALVINANTLARLALSGGRSVDYASAVQEQYAGGEALTPYVYVRRMSLLFRLLADSLGGVITETAPLAGPLGDPTALLLSLATIVGLEVCIRRRVTAPVLCVLSVAILLPLVNPRYEFSMPKARYLAPLLPVCFAAVGVAVVAAGAALRQRFAGRPASYLAVASLSCATLVLALVPLNNLRHYYQQARLLGFTNEPFYETVNAINQARSARETVYVDRNLRLAYTLGGGRLSAQLIFAGQVYGWPRAMIELSPPGADRVPEYAGIVVLHAADLEAAGDLYQLEEIASVPSFNPIVQIVRPVGVQPLQAGQNATPVAASPLAHEPVISGVSLPANLTFSADGLLFFTEVVEGRVRMARDGVLQDEPFAALPTTRGLEQGALGLALDPEFAANRWVYVFYSEADAQNRPVRNRVVRFTERDGRATEATPILGDLPINQTQFYNGDHNGGRLAFGPDGKLYVSIGEMVRRTRVQSLTDLYGKILRVERDGATPADNPIPGSPVYALGFRNVWGLTFHPYTGSLYATDNGPRGYDEVNLIIPRGNYAYPFIEGGPGGAPRFEDPIWHSGEDRLGITGLTIYDGNLFPEYRGNLFFCAFNNGALRRLHLTGPRLSEIRDAEIVSFDCRLDVTNGPGGTLYFSDFANVYRLVR